MKNVLIRQLITAFTIIISMIAGAIIATAALGGGDNPNRTPPLQANAQDQAGSETPATATLTQRSVAPSNTPTATQTLKPPPTLEPPTLTPAPSDTPTVTPTPTLFAESSLGDELQGFHTPTPETEPDCVPRDDWQLEYTVQQNDALANIAAQYGTTVNALVEANCLEDRNLIRINQKLKVPGEAHPVVVQQQQCEPWEVLTPFNGSVTIPGDGMLTFNWRGPGALRYLIRVYRPDGTMFERLVELRQNESISLTEHFPQAGTYTWYVYPLDENFKQIACREGGPWTFTKEKSVSLP